MSGVTKLLAMIVVLLVALLGSLLVFEVIPASVFGESVRKIIMLAVIIGLASAAIGFISRTGK